MDHLQCFELTLTTRAPLFIGCGKKYLKNAYLFDERAKRVRIVDEDAFFRLIVERGCVDRFERFMLGGGKLYPFLKNTCNFSEADIEGICRYSVSAEDALDAEHSLKEIHAFVRNAHGQAYVPGSSVKGALRTVLLQERILKDKNRAPLGDRDEIPEGKYLNTLQCSVDQSGRPKNDAVNSIMRGIQVSDSLPISDSAMMLSGKIDAGVGGMTHAIPLCRECVRPGTEIRLVVTLDQSVLKGSITAESLMASIRAYNDYYRKVYEAHFRAPQGTAGDLHPNCLILGGGAGYFSKTLTYPYLGEQQGMQTAIRILTKSFRNHRHESDVRSGISPRTMKYGRYRRSLYHYGLCEVKLT